MEQPPDYSTPYVWPDYIKSIGQKRGKISLDVISEAIKMSTANSGPVLLASVIASAPVCLGYGFGLYRYIKSFIGVVPSQKLNEEQIQNLFSSFILIPVLSLLGIILAAPGILSLSRMALLLRRGETISLSDALWGVKRAVPAIFIGIQQLLGTAIGLICCVIPGIAWMSQTMGAMAAYVDGVPGGSFGAVKASLSAFKNHLYMSIALCFLLCVFVQIGSSLFLIGVVFGMPLLAMGAALAYDDVSENQVALIQPGSE